MSTLFKKIIDKEIPSKIVYEDDKTIAFLDISQNTLGHTLVVPKTITKNVLTADEETVMNVNLIAHRIAKHLVTALDASGVNILTNANEVAGQTVDHYHVHVIPRYNEDELIFKTNTNEYDLDDVLERIKRAWL